MIAYIRGKIAHRSPTFVYLEAGNVAYHINISLNTYSKIEQLDELSLWIHLYMREDVQKLFGFFEKDERSLFVHLISISGIGPNIALLVLSSMTPEEVKSAIIQEAVHVFNQVKGIGPKTAKRIILDLKDKLIKEGFEAQADLQSPQGQHLEEARSALLSLGFQKSQVNKALAKVKSDEMPVESVVKEAIKHLSK